MTTKLVIPSYELPDYRFLQGLGSLQVGSTDGPATTLWELLLNFEDSQYPVIVKGKKYTKYDLLFQAAQILSEDESRASDCIQKTGVKTIREMCSNEGIDPNLY